MNFLTRLLDSFGILLSSSYLKHKSTSNEKTSYLNERTIEYSFALDGLLTNQCHDVLDVGTGDNSFAAVLDHCGYRITASDLKGSYWSSFNNRHIHVVRDDITKSHFGSESMDAILCISVLEHIANYHAAVQNMARIAKNGGVVILSFPYSHDSFCENVYKLETADPTSKTFPYIARSYSDREIESWCAEFNLVVSRVKYVRGWTGKYWRSGERIPIPYATESKAEANCICLELKKRS